MNPIMPGGAHGQTKVSPVLHGELWELPRRAKRRVLVTRLAQVYGPSAPENEDDPPA